MYIKYNTYLNYLHFNYRTTLHINMHPLTALDFWLDFTISKLRPWRPFTHLLHASFFSSAHQFLSCNTFVVFNKLNSTKIDEWLPVLTRTLYSSAMLPTQPLNIRWKQ